MNHSWLYIESQGLCILFLSVLFFYNLRYWKPNVLNYLSGIYLLTIIATALDICRAAFGGNPDFVWILHIITVLYSCALAFTGYFWFCYCIDQSPFTFLKNKNIKLLFTLPALIVCALAIISVHTGWLYYIDEVGHSHHGKFYFLQILDYLYITAASILSFICYKHAEFEREKRKFLVLTRFIILPICLSIIETFWPQNGLLIMSHAIFLSMLILFVNDQHQKILIDSLTGLPNRYGMDVALQERLSQTTKRDGKVKFSLLIGDLDEFKKINDTWGHLEGDRALLMTANALSKISKQYGATAYRMGGDEFAIITSNGDEEKTTLLCQKISEAISAIPFRDDFKLSMSLGRENYDGSMSVIELLHATDEKLYQEKAKKKVKNTF